MEIKQLPSNQLKYHNFTGGNYIFSAIIRHVNHQPVHVAKICIDLLFLSLFYINFIYFIHFLESGCLATTFYENPENYLSVEINVVLELTNVLVKNTTFYVTKHIIILKSECNTI